MAGMCRTIPALVALAAPAYAEAALPERVTPADGVTVATRREYYTVRAGTWRAAWLEMRHEGPKGALGDSAAYTDWKLGLKFPYQQVAGGCATGPVRVSLSVTYTLPRLEPVPPVEAGLDEKWAAFIEVTYLHEAGHRDLGVLAANAVRERLSASEPEPTCKALGAKVRKEVTAIIERYKTLEQRYDELAFPGRRPVARSFDAVLGLQLPGGGKDGRGERRRPQ